MTARVPGVEAEAPIMKSFFAKLITRIPAAAVAACDTFLFRRSLRRKLRDTEERLRDSLQKREVLESWINQANTVWRSDEESARAQLCRLRVVQETVRDRTGFMVGAFIPSGVLRALRQCPADQIDSFKRRVMAPLVDHAVAGLFRVNAKGNLTAMVFEPVGDSENPPRRVVPVFESDKDGQPVIEKFESLDLQIIQRETRHLTDGSGGGSLPD